MIYAKGKPISTIILGKDVAKKPEHKVISVAIRNGKIVWQLIRSCFGKGYWIEDKPWLDDDSWKD